MLKRIHFEKFELQSKLEEKVKPMWWVEKLRSNKVLHLRGVSFSPYSPVSFIAKRQKCFILTLKQGLLTYYRG